MARCTVYRSPGSTDPGAVPDTITDLDDIRLHRIRESLGTGDFCWIDVAEPDDAFMARVAEVFGIHELIAEDAVVALQRPKYERYGDQLLFVLRTVVYTPSGDDPDLTPDVTTGEVQVILGDNFVVTVNHGSTPDPDERVAENLERVLLPQTVLYSLADEIVDHYLEVSLQLEDDVSAMETRVFAPGSNLDIEEVYLLMREVLEIRHSIDPLTVALKLLVNDRELIVEDSRTYLRDVLDHQILSADRIGNHAERLASLVNAASAKISLQQNTDMRKISAWAAIAVVPTMIAGVYGMNFDDMPELHMSFGYPLVVGMMVLICLILIVLFRRNRWL